MSNDDLYKSLNTTSLYEQIVTQIEKLIISGQLKQGERLPAERELSERFGVSRTVIREAVRSLQEKGLVEVRPGVGTFVHNGMVEIMRQSLERMVLIDQQQGLENLMEVREILEPQIAALAADKATEEDLQTLKEAIDVMDQSMKDLEAYITADHHFHLALAEATQNQLLVTLIDSVVDLLRQQRKQIFTSSMDGPKKGQKHHKRIYKAISERNWKLARKAMYEHLQQVRADSIENTE